MKRRSVIASTAVVFATGAGCLGPLSRTKTIPVTVNNMSGSEKRVTIKVIREESQDETFSRTVVVPADEKTEFEIEDIKKTTAYEVPITTQSGISTEGRIAGPTQALRIVIKENGEIEVISTVA